mmetsp:Transcript_43189/g.100833  ORF Transcript_43189/g.100833 Transcript_43189/m.100833 type:complete len:80 (-) Transcript_43189:181-420(-)
MGARSGLISNIAGLQERERERAKGKGKVKARESQKGQGKSQEKAQERANADTKEALQAKGAKVKERLERPDTNRRHRAS